MKSVSMPERRSKLRLRPTRDRRRGRRQEVFDWKLPALLAFGAAIAMVAWFGRGNSDLRTGLVAVPILFSVNAAVIARVTRDEKRFDLTGLVYLSLAARVILSVPRFTSAVDASVYHQIGSQLAISFRDLDFSVETGRQIPGTGSVRYLSGLIHVLTFDDFYSSFLVFTLLAFWGTWFFYKAFVIAVPDGLHYRYAKLIFLWPSMLYWPSSLGKEACMTFTVGLAALGLAMLIARRRSGFVWLLLGVLGTTMVRPHMALVFLVAVVAALLIPRGVEGMTFKTATRVFALVILLIGGSILARTTAEFLNLENLGNESIETAFTRTEVMTDQGGSNFDAARVDSPIDYPWAVVTVLVRPLPFEAHTTESLATSFEGLVLLGLLLASLRSVPKLPRLVRRYSYIGFAIVFVLVFGYVFSVIGNFGILARQRTQVLPLVFVFLALPSTQPNERARFHSSRSRRRNAGVSRSIDAVQAARLES